MTEFVHGLFTGYLLSWPGLVALLLLGIVFEHNGARGWAVAAGLLSAALSYFIFDVEFKVIAVVAVGYLIVGVLWSFWRYRVFVHDSIEIIQAVRYTNLDHRNDRLQSLHPSRNLRQITGWIIIWPFSMIEKVLGDVIRGVQALVTKVFKSVYTNAFTLKPWARYLTPK